MKAKTANQGGGGKKGGPGKGGPLKACDPKITPTEGLTNDPLNGLDDLHQGTQV